MFMKLELENLHEKTSINIQEEKFKHAVTADRNVNTSVK